MSELASEYGVHITQLRKWKTKVLEALPTVFDGDQAHRQQLKELETEQEKLYAEIGRLTTQLNWLKKKGFDIE